MNKLKTLKDLKIGDYIYETLICWVGMNVLHQDNFWREYKYKIIYKDETCIYYINDNGGRRGVIYIDSPVKISKGDNVGENDIYSTCIYSSYSVYDKNNLEFKKELNKLLHNFFVELSKYIQKQLYDQIELKDEYKDYGEVKTEYQEKIVEVPVETKIEVNKNIVQKFDL